MSVQPDISVSGAVHVWRCLQANSATLVRAGERAEFRIISRDQFGNVRSQGGDEFKVAVRMTERPGKTEVQVRLPPLPAWHTIDEYRPCTERKRCNYIC